MSFEGDTLFAPAARATEEEVSRQAEVVAESPIMTGLLQAVGGLIAILNEQRQVVALNEAFFELLGIRDPAGALGLRFGQTLRCRHADEGPSGCGTTRWCSTCGAAVAMVSSLSTDGPVERLCSLQRDEGEATSELQLSVRSQPIELEGERYLLIFMRDVSEEQWRAELERTFFHDIKNVLNWLVMASNLVTTDKADPQLLKIIKQSSSRLAREVSLQQSLRRGREVDYRPVTEHTTVGRVFEELRAIFGTQRLARDRTLSVAMPDPDLQLSCDAWLLFRVLQNMVTNALEATALLGTVRVYAEVQGDRLSLCVWNAEAIPREVAQRIFERSFSTKAGSGRGVGTYSMKLFGEKYLGGQVSFTTSEADGTVFRLALPGPL